MTSNIEFKYNGKVYQPTLEESSQSCSGCAFLTENGTCAADEFPATDQDVVWKCTGRWFIWEEKGSSTEIACNKPEPEVMTWTLDEIHQAYEDWDMYDGFSVLARILRKQKQGQDPEYQKYLELKAKFGD